MSVIVYNRPMTDDYQIEIPPSFYALYVDGRGRLSLPLAAFRQRYETCEDLAQHLTAHCLDVHREIGAGPEDVLTRVHRGLLAPASAMPPAEARWVVTRLAELLGWPSLAENEPGSTS